MSHPSHLSALVETSYAMKTDIVTEMARGTKMYHQLSSLFPSLFPVT